MTGPANEATAVAGEMGGIPAWHMLCKGSARKVSSARIGAVPRVGDIPE